MGNYDKLLFAYSHTVTPLANMQRTNQFVRLDKLDLFNDVIMNSKKQ